MLKRHEIKILLKAGHPKTEVARLAGVSARSVHRFAEEHPVVDVNDSAERAQRHILRPSIVEDFRKLVLDSLKEKADLCSLLRPAGERFTHLYMDFAAGLQNTLQEKVHILYHFAGETKLRKSMPRGGHNCTLNGRILESDCSNASSYNLQRTMQALQLGAAYSVFQHAAMLRCRASFWNLCRWR